MFLFQWVERFKPECFGFCLMVFGIIFSTLPWTYSIECFEFSEQQIPKTPFCVSMKHSNATKQWHSKLRLMLFFTFYKKFLLQKRIWLTCHWNFTNISLIKTLIFKIGFNLHDNKVRSQSVYKMDNIKSKSSSRLTKIGRKKTWFVDVDKWEKSIWYTRNELGRKNNSL